jgi:hypothetical protein
MHATAAAQVLVPGGWLLQWCLGSQCLRVPYLAGADVLREWLIHVYVPACNLHRRNVTRPSKAKRARS